MVFIPCGFSALYDKHYADYYKLMPAILRQFDHLIFYASDYRDINFARDNNITNFSIIPNGASEIEFGVAQEKDFRERLNINKNDFLLIQIKYLNIHRVVMIRISDINWTIVEIIYLIVIFIAGFIITMLIIPPLIKFMKKK